MPLPPSLERFRTHVGMYVMSETLDAVLAFLAGYDLASSGGLLVGFREWLIVKFNDGNNQSWEGLVRQMIGRNQAESDQQQQIAAAFQLLEEFLDVRQSKTGGLLSIYSSYEKWLIRHQLHA